METIDYIGDCIVHTFIMGNDDYYDSDINESILRRHHKECEKASGYERFSPFACNNTELISTDK